jgi:sugar lactone lactonase YvrE
MAGPTGVVLDRHGNLYGVDSTSMSIIQWKSPLVAQATASTFVTFKNSVRNFRMDVYNNMYVAGGEQHVVYKVDPTGVVTIVAGKENQSGFTGDGGPATAALMNYIQDVAISTFNGDLYIADGDNNRIRKVDGSTGIISTYAGNGGIVGTDNEAATSSGFNWPTSVALDANDNLFIADLHNSAIRYVNKATGIITTIAGQLSGGSEYGDGVPATSVGLRNPSGVTYDPQGMLWIIESNGGSWGIVRMVDFSSQGNIITTVATGMLCMSQASIFCTLMSITDPY